MRRMDTVRGKWPLGTLLPVRTVGMGNPQEQFFAAKGELHGPGRAYSSSPMFVMTRPTRPYSFA